MRKSHSEQCRVSLYAKQPPPEGVVGKAECSVERHRSPRKKVPEFSGTDEAIGEKHSVRKCPCG